MKKVMLLTALFTLLLVMASCGRNQENNESAKVITGAGATFPQPFYNKIFKTYTKSVGKVLVTYGGIGSGGGIRSLKDKVVDFGATDAFLNDKKLASMPSEVLHIPTCLGAVVIAYNLPGKPKLKLNQTLLEDIFMGKITNWNDKAIAKINRSVKLPDLKITFVHRSDGSGTTFIFSDYMSKISTKWKQVIGSGKSLKWLCGIGAKGNPGVAGTISQTDGAIGYIGSEYAFAQGIPFAQIQNKSGNFIEPTVESVSASATGTIPDDTRVTLTNTGAENGYPITSFTWLIFYKDQYYNNRSHDQALQTVKLLNWILEDNAQKVTKKVHYAPLPKQAVAKAKTILKKVTYKGKAILK